MLDPGILQAGDFQAGHKGSAELGVWSAEWVPYTNV